MSAIDLNARASADFDAKLAETIAVLHKPRKITHL
jgi:hypothetical protein